MKAISIVVIVIACLVSACSSSQLQSARERSDKQVTIAFLDEQIDPGTNPANWHQIPATSTARDGTLVGSCCEP
jgi:predicted component of type VI protein secretion system